jgi:hypothetical protein
MIEFSYLVDKLVEYGWMLREEMVNKCQQEQNGFGCASRKLSAKDTQLPFHILMIPL